MAKKQDSKADKGKQASIDGFAHEHIVVGILMKKFQNVSLVDLPLSSYDIIIAREIEGEDKEDIIRVQVKHQEKIFHLPVEQGEALIENISLVLKPILNLQKHLMLLSVFNQMTKQTSILCILFQLY